MRAAVYTRISTDEQRQPFSLEAQQDRLRSYVESQGWELVEEPYADQASGASLQRPALARLLERAKAGGIDVVLAYRVDRVARTLRGLVDLLEQLNGIGVGFRSATEPFDTATASGRMMLQMLGVFAEFERATIIDRIVAGMERKAARGQWQTGQGPHGYQVDQASGRLTPVESEAAQVEAIFDLYVHQRLGAAGVAATLNRRGLRTRAAKPWTAKTVLHVLRNRVYLGEIYYRGTWHHGAGGPFHPPLVDAEVFTQAEQILTTRRADHGARSSNGSDYLLSGLLTCTLCGGRFVGTSAHSKGRRYRYYTCATRQQHGTTGCRGPRLPADRLEEAVTQAVAQTLINNGLLTEAATRCTERATTQQQACQRELDAVRSDLATTRRSIDRYLTSFERDTIPEELAGARLRDLAERNTALTAREAELRRRLATSPGTSTAKPDPDLSADQLAVALRAAPAQTLKALYRVLIDRVGIGD